MINKYALKSPDSAEGSNPGIYLEIIPCISEFSTADSGKVS